MAVVEDLPKPLRAIASDLEETGWAAEVCDADWRLVYVTSQLRGILGRNDDADLALGRHILEVRGTPFWQSIIDPEQRSGTWMAENVPQMLADDPSVRDCLADMVIPELRPIVEEAEPAQVGTWTSVIRLRSVGASLGLIRYFGERARSPDGTPAATLYLYGSNLPAGLLAMVTRGRLTHFSAWLAWSSRDSARPRSCSPTWRRRGSCRGGCRAAPTSSSSATSARRGRRDHRRRRDRGDHAGDGVTAFFVVDDFGSASHAARAAIEVGRGLQAGIERAGAAVGLGAGEVRLRVGVHWSGTLYMGQVVTGGRLEVTALGDEVNECARLEQSAAGGALLASKALIERLEPADAAAVGLDPAHMTYRALADLDGADEKAVRDAGLIAVARIDASLAS